MNERHKGRIVYSTELGRCCPECGKAKVACCCKENAKLETRKLDGTTVRIRRETKGRNGKGVTVVSGIPLDSVGLKELEKRLKQKCGTGGTVKEGHIEIQGDHRETLLVELQRLGYKPKIAGG